MAVYKGNNNGGKKGGGGRSPRPDFTPSKSTGLYLRFDCVAGRAKIVGHASGELFSRKCRFNIDIANLRGRLARLPGQRRKRDRRDGSQQPASWCRREATARSGVSRCGSRCPTRRPSTTSRSRRCRPALIRTSTALLLEALASLWDAYDEDTKHKEGDIACVEVAGWESVTKAGGKKYFRPRFKILGLREGSRRAVRGRQQQRRRSDAD